MTEGGSSLESGDVVAVVVVAIHLFLFGAMVREWRRIR